MNKEEFFVRLRKHLSGLSEKEREERLSFYAEMIADRMEEGLSEEEAVRAIGDLDEILSSLPSESSETKRENVRERERKAPEAWVIVLLVLGSPIWLALLVSAFAVVLSLYVTLWSIPVSLWATFGATAGCSIGGILFGIGQMLDGNALIGVALIGAGLVALGLSVFLLFICRVGTKGMVVLTKKAFSWIKGYIVERGRRNA